MVDYKYNWANGTAVTTTDYWPTGWIQSTATNSISTNNIWFEWTGTGSVQPYQIQLGQSIWKAAMPPVQTPEQIEAARVAEEERQAAWRAEVEHRETERREAQNRAKILLEENLSDEQRAQLRDNNWFEVITPKGHYRIRHGRSGNVDKLVDGRAVERFCIHPTEDVPNEDTMLIQKLLLETDEAAFRRIANITRL